jgi:Flp pilus assembly protein TadB
MGFFWGLGMAIFFGVSLKLVIGAAAFGVLMATFLVWRVAEKARTRSSK